MFPGRAEMHRWATDSGRNVPRVCGAVLLGNGMGQKCSPGVRRGTLGLRKRAEMFPERAARPPWATELGGSVPRVCGVVLLGDGTGPKCSPSVKCGTLGRRKAAKPSPKGVFRNALGGRLLFDKAMSDKWILLFQSVSFQSLLQYQKRAGKVFFLKNIRKPDLIPAKSRGAVESCCRSHHHGLTCVAFRGSVIFVREVSQAPRTEVLRVFYR